MSKGVLVAHNKLEANLQDQRGQGGHGAIPLSAGMLLVTLGVVYGDIGTSPMYTMKSIVANNGGIGTVSEDMILGALSLVIWTMTLVTTVKYVVIAMKADNHNEGGHLRPVQSRAQGGAMADSPRHDRRRGAAR